MPLFSWDDEQTNKVLPFFTVPTPALMIWASIEPSLGIISACLPLCYSASKLRSQDAILDANALDYNTMDSSQTVYTSPEGLPMYAGKFPNQHEDAMG